MKLPKKAVVYALLIGMISVVIYLLPLLINQQDSYVLIHDNLDCHPMQFANIYRDTSPIIHDSQFPQILNGSLRPSSGINLNFSILPYHFFSPFTAYLLLQLTSRLTAFFGMFLLLRTLVSREQGEQLLISCGVAVLFAILPHYPPLAFTIPVLPWLCWSFININRNNSRWRHWAPLVIAPFLSNFFVAPVFLFVLVGIWWVHTSIKAKQIKGPLLGALILCGAVYIITEHHLLLSLFNDTGYESIRSERSLHEGWLGFLPAMRKSAGNFLFGHYHVFTLHELILPIAATALFLHRRSCAKQSRESSILIGIVLLCGATSLWYGFYSWQPAAQWRVESLSVLNMIGWDRLHWLHPLLWYVVFAYSLVLLDEAISNGRVVIALLLLLQGIYIFSASDFFNEKRSNHISFRQFYAEKQFSDIKDYIGQNTHNYKVVGVGIHPSVPIFNGFYTLDGYSPDYALEHKNNFREVISPELKKNQISKRYFETFGPRCYVFSGELGKRSLYTKWKKARSINRLDLNLDAFSELGGRYILSAVEIKQAKNCGLKLLKVFDSEESAWQIYLYEPTTLSVR